MQRAVFALFILCVVVLAAVQPASAGKRVALVIGNSDYLHTTKLPNPRNDAEDMSSALTRLGFEVTRTQDLNFESMRQALRSFSRVATGSDMAIVFYAGHGIEVNKQNYLIPTDARLETDRDISFEAIPLDLITEAVAGSRGLKLVMLDACRNNPFAATMKMTSSTRSIGRGLAGLEPEVGTLVAYASKDGTVADDGEGRNSPYTAALLEHLKEPGLEISFLFRKVRDSVMAVTQNRQQPFTYGSLPGRRIFLNASKPVVTPAPTVKTIAPSVPNASMELALWNEVKGSGDAGLFGAYLSRFPNGIFSDVAKARIAKLKESESKASSKNQQVASLPKKVTPKTSSSRSAIELGQLGDEAWDKKDYSVAHEWYLKSANLGRRSAMHRVAYMYQNSRGVQQDYAQALIWYRKSSDEGSSASMGNLGNMYRDGQGVTQDYNEAIRLYRKAIKTDGDEYAYYNLGGLYLNGRGVTTDYGEALRLLKISSDKGHSGALNRVGFMYAEGKGVPVDNKEAIRWYRKAIDKGSSVAMYNLGNKYRDGKGVKQDYKQAVSWYRKAVKKGDTDAMYSLGRFYQNGWGLKANPRKAAELIARSIKSGGDFAVKEMTTNANGWKKQFRVELQRQLRSSGVYDGPLDGSFGPATKAAIRKLASNS